MLLGHDRSVCDGRASRAKILAIRDTLPRRSSTSSLTYERDISNPYLFLTYFTAYGITSLAEGCHLEGP